MAIKNIEHLLQDFWENRTIGILSDSLDLISAQTLIYLKERCPYVQMISIQAQAEETIIPKFTKSPVGWLMHDYGQAMSTSPGHCLYSAGHSDFYEDEEGGGGQGGADGVGTLTRQVVETAKAMVALAMEKGWPGIEIIAGTEFMKWAMWFAAQEKDYPFTGYSPDRAGQRKLERIRSIIKSRTPEATTAITPQQKD